MLYKLEIENFYSIRDQQILDLTIAPNVPDPEGRYAPIFEGSQLRAPKVIAIYGANASGKTTVLRALNFLFGMVRDSSGWSGTGVPCERFNDLESSSRPIRLAVELGGVMNYSPDIWKRVQSGEKVEQGVYRYEISIEVKDGMPLRITSESLRQKPNAEGKWQRVFERDNEGRVKDSKIFSLTGFHHLLNTLRPNTSVLSSFSLFQHPVASLFVDEARKAFFQIGGRNDLEDKQIIDFLVSRPEVLVDLNKELNRIDVGVEEMKFQLTTNGPQPFFRHAGLQVEMPWFLESHGTRSFIKMFPALSLTLKSGGLCVIDELDLSIHPLILPEIISWFYNQKNKNAFNAQLWLSCHSASLLDSLKKEEIVICEKDLHGRTTLYSLMDVKIKARRDDNHYRKYLGGVYGGVPQIG